MSDEFLEFNFPCKDCLVRAVCEEKPNITDKEKQDLIDRVRTHCLTIPYVAEDKHYHKMLIECWINMGKAVFDSVGNVENPHGMNAELKVPISMIFQLRDMANIGQYIVNTLSWQKGELHDFDIDEVRRKLKAIFR